jgi:hypothetical protein
MLTLASLLVTAILAPAPSPELRNPMGPDVPRAAAPAPTAAQPCPCTCADGRLREPFPSAAPQRASTRTVASTELRDPFDAPRRATAPVLREPKPARRMRAPGPKPAAQPSELRSPFGRA